MIKQKLVPNNCHSIVGLFDDRYWIVKKLLNIVYKRRQKLTMIAAAAEHLMLVLFNLLAFHDDIDIAKPTFQHEKTIYIRYSKFIL